MFAVVVWASIVKSKELFVMIMAFALYFSLEVL